jgi:translation elongation factor EF-1alpha
LLYNCGETDSHEIEGFDAKIQAEGKGSAKYAEFLENLKSKKDQAIGGAMWCFESEGKVYELFDFDGIKAIQFKDVSTVLFWSSLVELMRLRLPSRRIKLKKP